MSGGTFQVSRDVWEHPVFAPSKFSEREAFLWMISAACWESKVVRSGSVVIDLERGQLCFSLRFLAEKWGWSKTTVSRFLKTLKKRDMIYTDSGTGQNIISVCNYSKYQLVPKPKRDSGGTESGTEAGQRRDSGGTKSNTVNTVNTDTNVSSGQSVRVLCDRHFQDFWDAFPHRGGKKTKRASAETAFLKALRSGATVDQIAMGVQDMHRDTDVSRGYGRGAVPWLNQQGWKDEIPTEQEQLESTSGGKSNDKRNHNNGQTTNVGQDAAIEQIAKIAGLSQT